MTTVITNSNLAKHSVNKYTFKVLSIGDDSSSDSEFTSSLIEQVVKEDVQTSAVEVDNTNRRESDVDSSSLSKGSKDALIESLMKKTDEMSSNFIKLQMKLESKEEEYQANLEKTKEKSYNDGLVVGEKNAKANTDKNLTNGIAQFSSSVTALENSAKEFETALEAIKADLITAAVDISKEVINVELGENSSEIANVLGEALVTELQSASKITLKVNPKDHGLVSEKVGLLEHIQIISDSAVSVGGVIAISDAGNIDSQISKRFERVKKAALSE